MNICDAGHRRHESHQVETELGPMLVWDTQHYMGFRGYCTGQDDVSQTLERLGVWEREETDQISRRLQPGDVVLDFGAHIGWFTLLATSCGAVVHAYEGDVENLDLLRENARRHGVAEQVAAYPVWVDARASLPIPEGPIRLVKVDLEGNDEHAVRCLEQALLERRVEELVVEISPCFNGRYPALVAKLQGYGYEVFRGGAPWDGSWDFHQDNFWFRRTA